MAKELTPEVASRELAQSLLELNRSIGTTDQFANAERRVRVEEKTNAIVGSIAKFIIRSTVSGEEDEDVRCRILGLDNESLKPSLVFRNNEIYDVCFFIQYLDPDDNPKIDVEDIFEDLDLVYYGDMDGFKVVKLLPLE